jgi:hypothetical protein
MCDGALGLRVVHLRAGAPAGSLCGASCDSGPAQPQAEGGGSGAPERVLH